jgi:hypothetical protein
MTFSGDGPYSSNKKTLGKAVVELRPERTASLGRCSVSCWTKRPSRHSPWFALELQLVAHDVDSPTPLSAITSKLLAQLND